jgi:crotonobetainyl-CoA:carnitine CoA-transferase CaiB-like acyl-CoA transferase
LNAHPNAEDAVPGPLGGIRVLDISTVYAAPITAMLLGDFGADVIKVEHPRGDPARSHGANKNGHGLWWKVISRNKRCVTLNLGTSEGQQIFRALARDADVLVENFRPGVLEGWGLGPERLHAFNSGLIMLRVTGFGQTGPYSRRRAFGTLAEAMSGFAHQTGDEDGPPTLPPFGLADGVCGIAGGFAVMTALYHRATSGGGGRGQVIDLSLLEPLLAILGPGPTAYDQTRCDPRPAGQPFAEQRPAQYISHQRWPLGCHLRQRHLRRRESHAAGRSTRHRRAGVVRFGG